ncbi:unnamed protein product [Moneuplotes crassus]|uniref:Uncharacterized protein n=2 Tax=Euplotes crassus TaxID=5936 RepID=A0AAD1UPC2_EUPCR|nr:unnamed protein product [Moneuplotes crassus]
MKRIQHKLRNFSKEKLKKIGKLNLPKNGFQLKLKKDNVNPKKLFDQSESVENDRKNSDSDSIFNVTFGNFKFTPKQQTNNATLFCKGKNFNSEGTLPPNFALEDVFLKYELSKQKQLTPENVLNRKEGIDTKCSRNEQQYVRYFHTSDGIRRHNNASLEPYKDSLPYFQQSKGEINLQNSLKIYRSHLENSTLSSEARSRSNPEEDSPFFIKRRIRSSNPHARVKRKAHPMISKHFFKKQMSRHGNRSKLLIQDDDKKSSEEIQKKCGLMKSISNSTPKDISKGLKICTNIYLSDGREGNDSFEGYCRLEDIRHPTTKNYK